MFTTMSSDGGPKPVEAITGIQRRGFYKDSRMSAALPDQVTQTIAVLTTCLVQALGENDSSLIPAFEEKLEEIYARMRDNSYFLPETLQAVKLVGDLLKR